MTNLYHQRNTYEHDDFIMGIYENCSEYNKQAKTANQAAMYISLFSCSVSLILGILMWITLKRMARAEEGSELRPGSRRLLTSLTLADLFRVMVYILGVARFLASEDYNHTEISCNPSQYCMMISFLGIWSNLSAYLWTLVIGIYFSVKASRAHRSAIQRRFDKVWNLLNLICWVLPLLPAMFGFAFGALGENQTLTVNGVCWITSCPDLFNPILWMALTKKIWEFLISVSIVAIYMLAKFRLYIRTRETWHNLRPIQSTSTSRPNQLLSYGSISSAYSLPSSATLSPITSPISSLPSSIRTDSSPGAAGSNVIRPILCRRPFMTESKEENLFLFLILFLYLGRCFGFFRYILYIFHVYCIADQYIIEWLNFNILIYLQNFGDNSQATLNFVVFLVYCQQARELILGMLLRKRKSRLASAI